MTNGFLYLTNGFQNSCRLNSLASWSKLASAYEDFLAFILGWRRAGFMLFSWWTQKVKRDTLFLIGLCSELARSHILPISLGQSESPDQAWSQRGREIQFTQSWAMVRSQGKGSFKRIPSHFEWPFSWV